MHIIRKLRLSISHRPRHLFDLPDEILQQILAYCCEDLHFLLWSCPSRASHGLVDFCLECSYCSQCHLLAQQRARRSTLRHRARHAARLSRCSLCEPGLQPTTVLATGVSPTVTNTTTTPSSPKVNNGWLTASTECRCSQLPTLPARPSTLPSFALSSITTPSPRLARAGSSSGGTDSNLDPKLIHQDLSIQDIRCQRRQRRQRRRLLQWQRQLNALNPVQSYPPLPSKRYSFELSLSWLFSNASNHNSSNNNNSTASFSNVRFQSQRAPYEQGVRQRGSFSPWTSPSQSRFQEFLAFLDRLQLSSEGWARWTSWWKNGKLLRWNEYSGHHQQHQPRRQQQLHIPASRSRPLRSSSPAPSRDRQGGTSSSFSQQSHLSVAEQEQHQQQVRRRRPRESASVNSPYQLSTSVLPPTPSRSSSSSSISQPLSWDSQSRDMFASMLPHTASTAQRVRVSMHETSLHHLREGNTNRKDFLAAKYTTNSILDKDDSCSCDEDEVECDDDTDDSSGSSDSEDEILLSGPFNLLLVSKRFADAAVGPLWQSLVFHGHDPTQIEALLGTLYKNDGHMSDEENNEDDFLVNDSIPPAAWAVAQQPTQQKQQVLDRWGREELGQQNTDGPCAPSLQNSTPPATIFTSLSSDPTTTTPPSAWSTTTNPRDSRSATIATTLAISSTAMTAGKESGTELPRQIHAKGPMEHKETGNDATGTTFGAAVECTTGVFDVCGTCSCPTCRPADSQNNNTMKHRAMLSGFDPQGAITSTVCLEPIAASASVSADATAHNNAVGSSSRATRVSIPLLPSPLSSPHGHHPAAFPTVDSSIEIEPAGTRQLVNHSIVPYDHYTAPPSSSTSSSSFSSPSTTIKGKERLQSVNDDRPFSVESSPSSPLLSSPVHHSGHHNTTNTNTRSRWPYRRYVRRLVLNFAHPQASPQQLVDVLECINLQCPNQVQALDLHANEKMRAAGLEQTLELERLFGSGFANLRYLRLQGGFVDNRLLSALLKGMRPPTTSTWGEQASSSSSNSRAVSPQPQVSKSERMAGTYATKIPTAAPRLQPCRLSQVFLGPGSVTDSAIEKLVAVAGHSLEVFRVMSCVDVGGGALATLLTRCPKLRVLGVYRSLARDRDLLEGLGIELEDGFPMPPTTLPGALPAPAATTAAGTIGFAALTPTPSAPAANFMTATAAFNINTATTIPFAALNTNNLGSSATTGGTYSNPIGNDINGVIAGAAAEKLSSRPAPKKIVAPLERLELGTVKLTRKGVEEIIKGVNKTLRFLVLETQHLSESFLQDTVMPLGLQLEALHFNNPIKVENHHPLHPHAAHGHHGPLGRPAEAQILGDFSNGSAHKQDQPKISDWLGDTTTDQWVTYGDGALWASVFDGYFEAGGGANQQQQQQQQQHAAHQHHQQHHPQHPATATPMFQHHQQQQHHVRGDQATPFWFQAMDSDEILEHFSVRRSTVDAVLASLPRLKAFTVMQWDLLSEKDGAWEWMQIEREEAKWVQSLGFRALQALYLFLLLSYVFLSGVSVVGVGSQPNGRSGSGGDASSRR